MFHLEEQQTTTMTDKLWFCLSLCQTENNKQKVEVFKEKNTSMSWPG